jgi:hypothetical protein
LSQFDEPRLVADKLSYVVGDKASFQFLSPVANAKLLVQWGNALETKHHLFTIAKAGRNTLSLPTALGRECRLGCQLVASLIAGRDNTRKLAVTVPTSRLFDLRAPVAFELREALTIVNDELNLGEVVVSTDADDDTTSPRATLEITVDVKDIDGKALSSGEVHVFVVDKKVLDLAPHAVLRAQDGFQTSLSTGLSVSNSQRALQLASEYENTLQQVNLSRSLSLSLVGVL